MSMTKADMEAIAAMIALATQGDASDDATTDDAKPRKGRTKPAAKAKAATTAAKAMASAAKAKASGDARGTFTASGDDGDVTYNLVSKYGKGRIFASIVGGVKPQRSMTAAAFLALMDDPAAVKRIRALAAKDTVRVALEDGDDDE